MISLIEQHRPEVAALCSRFGVQSLDVFGSAADGAFDAACSDIDFLVEFSQDDKGSLFHRYFGLQEALENVFRRKIGARHGACLRDEYDAARHRFREAGAGGGWRRIGRRPR